jgi:hypothetical protein
MFANCKHCDSLLNPYCTFHGAAVSVVACDMDCKAFEPIHIEPNDPPETGQYISLRASWFERDMRNWEHHGVTYEDRAKAWVTQYEVKPGSLVRVEREAFSGERGWLRDWDLQKGSYVGEVCVVDGVHRPSWDVMLFGGYSFPYFILEPIRRAE